MEKTLDILVVEDKDKNRFAARKQLSEHNVTVIENAHDAADLIAGGRYTKVQKQHFDVLLTDMKLPMGKYTSMNQQKRDNYAGHWTFDFGYALALLAGREGIPYIGILSDADHHSDPMDTMWSYLTHEKKDGKYNRVKTRINNSILIASSDTGLMLFNDEFVHCPMSEGSKGHTKATYERIDGTRFVHEYDNMLPHNLPPGVETYDNQIVFYKNWKGLLNQLLEHK